MDSIEMMRENQADVPEGMMKISDRIEAVIGLVEELWRDSARITRIEEKVERLHIRANGKL
jgi:hypothetical protein